MGRYNQINLDGKSDTVSAPSAAELKPGTFVTFNGSVFTAAADGTKRLYIAEKSQTSIDVDTAIAAGDNVNGDKVVSGRIFAGMLNVSQVIAVDDGLKIVGGKLTKAAAGEETLWANEAVTTSGSQNFLISATVK